MELTGHVLTSAAVSCGVFAATGSALVAGASFAAGVLIDVDHILDYWGDHAFNMNINKFFKTCHECDLTKTRLVLHSAELVVILGAAAFITRSALIAGITLGVSQHLALDQVTNRVYPASYFIIYRWMSGFKSETVFNKTKDNGNDQ